MVHNDNLEKSLEISFCKRCGKYIIGNLFFEVFREFIYYDINISFLFFVLTPIGLYC